MTWTADDLPDLRGRTAIVTGANSGIGWPTAAELAKHGARVVLACRDAGRAAEAVARIRRAVPSADVDAAELDLADLASVRAFAASWSGPLQLLVNNAGVMATPTFRTTRDGFELQFGTNHLGHYVLTGLLLDALLAAGDARVVTVSSIRHRSGTSAVLDANVGAGYSTWDAYANSKLANLLFARELSRQAQERGLPLTSVAAHPGFAATGLVRSPDGMGARRLARAASPALMRMVAQSATAGARATLYAATEAAPGSYTGPRFFGETRGPIGPARPSSAASDEQLGRQLWAVSEELTGLRYPWPA
jgi:NAD(P)-dependent dehydrogenase (short-subunit alcohol dehydrogenase family)